MDAEEARSCGVGERLVMTDSSHDWTPYGHNERRRRAQKHTHVFMDLGRGARCLECGEDWPAERAPHVGRMR